MNDWIGLLLGMAQLFWVSAMVAGLLAFPIYKLLLKAKSRQIISQFVEEHQKKQGTPTMGGLITVVGVVAGLLYALAMGLYPAPMLVAALVLMLGFGLLGFCDDYLVPKMIPGNRGLEWKQKLLGQIVIACLAAWIGNRHGSVVSMGVVVFLILFFSNAYNFADGMDGLAGSILVLFAAGLAGIALIDGRIDATPAICAALVGGIIPFLFLNAPPAKMFMGDVGALPIGAVLGLVVAELSRPGRSIMPLPAGEKLGMTPPTPFNPIWGPLIIVSFVLIAELLPPPIQVASVKLTGKRIFPMTPIHHAFEKAGWPETRVVWCFALVQALCSALAVGMALGYR